MTIDEVIQLLRFNNKHFADLGNTDLLKMSDWLEELKAYRESVFSGDMTQAMLKEEYNKAIDDLISKCESAKFADDDETVISDIHQGVNSGLSMAIHFAKELRGRENE